MWPDFVTISRLNLEIQYNIIIIITCKVPYLDFPTTVKHNRCGAVQKGETDIV